ncbi:hypothetical protein RTCIAT899_PB00525 (plasmid) [Rhizobium tropici CIAT 899]|uniref:Uncharacterized protein n=2 Tax=Rhizobium TaxID=379 RepID=A0A1C3X971_9HYPH|nr:hypothetical protein RTCIAT899_PB00525 [Rhizobium tropici CIAT 899]MBB4245302.1 hypothetical protein [Rhizobium tropici]MBB6305269.1 hypothetical protein [Rhizobium leucaenae]MBB6489477.1 hypothetical protein [Rhizobium lusitanum]MBB5596699.1 hypothetical protein [Rhizobium tropici]
MLDFNRYLVFVILAIGSTALELPSVRDKKIKPQTRELRTHCIGTKRTSGVRTLFR